MMIGVVTGLPDTFGIGKVRVRDEVRLCYYQPQRMDAAPASLWPVAEVGDRVVLGETNGKGLTALWVIGRGTPGAQVPVATP